MTDQLIFNSGLLHYNAVLIVLSFIVQCIFNVQNVSPLLGTLPSDLARAGSVVRRPLPARKLSETRETLSGFHYYKTERKTFHAK